jgi:hypothetical protein
VPAAISSRAVESALADADIRPNMRTLGFRTHVLLVLAGTVGIIASLGRPWYGRPPAPLGDNSERFDVHGPLRGVVDAAGRWVSEAGGTTGWDALGTSGQVFAGLSLLAAVCALGCMVPALQALVGEPLRYVSFAVFGIAVWRVVDTPGPNEALELRLGALIAIVSATMLWVCAQGVASAPSRRRVVPPRYTPPPPPPVYYEAR